MKYLSSLGSFIKRNRIAAGVIIVLLVVLFIFGGDKKPEYSSFVVQKTDVIDAVELTGTVSSVDRADLGFQASGEIVSVLVDEGQEVSKGDVLARLDSGTLTGELSRAQAGVESAQASIDSAKAALNSAQANLQSVRAGNSGTISTIAAAKSNLAEVTNEQNRLVENAQKALLTTDLQAYPVDASRNLPQPVITGSYQGAAGTYNLDFYRSGAGSGYSARYTGLESGTISFPDNGLPVALGSNGLFVGLPDSTFTYAFTDFNIPIPNTRSSGYQTLINNIETAKAAREKFINAAQSELDRLQASENTGSSVTTAEEKRALAGVESAQASVSSASAAYNQALASVSIVRSQLSDRTLTAPFSGTVARTDLQIGENVVANQTVATIVSKGDFEIELQVPEIDVARLEVGMSADITLDAYGDARSWQGEIVSIEQIETTVEGVPVYITAVKINNPDSSIKIGMNARASIELERFSDVIAIPQSFIQTEGDRNYVIINNNDQIVERDVTTGIRGANSLVQITSGLATNDVVSRVITENE